MYRCLAMAAVALMVVSGGLEARTKRPVSKAKRARAVRKALPQPVYTADAVNNAAITEPITGKANGPVVLKAQILLDRAHFGVGEIDGNTGGNFYRALSGFRVSRGQTPDPVLDAGVWQALTIDTAPALMPYTITADDVKGPFEPIPSTAQEQAQMKQLGYASIEEELGEKFHCSPKLLRTLNPDAKFTEGEAIQVPNVVVDLPIKASRVEVSKSKLTVEVYGEDGKLVAQYPASVGSEHDPLPIGDWKILGVARNPKFHYNPALFWDANPTETKLTLPPGPNGPVGPVWIDLSKPHYGIHGTPEPSKIGYTQSHGCIRLTNWDVIALAGMVRPNLPAILKD